MNLNQQIVLISGAGRGLGAAIARAFAAQGASVVINYRRSEAAALAETGSTSLKQMGLVMKAAQAKLAGKRVDGKVLSDKVRARLG